VIDFGRNDVDLHIAAREAHQPPRKILIGTLK